MYFLLVILTTSAMRALLLPIVAICYIIACVLWVASLFCLPVLLGLSCFVIGFKLTSKMLTSKGYYDDVEDLIIGGSISISQKVMTIPTDMFMKILDKIQQLQDRMIGQVG